MPMPRLPQLLTSLDGETHAARCRRIVDLARVGRGTPELGQLIDELAAQSDYHAVLAVVAAAVAGDEPRLDRLAHHPSGRVARAAQAGLPLTGAAEVIAGRYREASPNDRRLLRRRLGREGRTDVVDQLIRSDIDDTERAGLLAAATAQVAAEYLPDLADLVPNLASVTHRHLGLVLAHLRERTLGAPPPQRDHWWAWAGPAIGQLIAEHPAAVLELLETAGPSTVLTTDVTRHLGALIRHDPHRAATLFAHPRHPIGYRVPAGLLTYAGLLAPGDRVAIARRLLDRDDLLATFLDALPPSERAATFDAAIVDIGVDQRIWSDALLEVLPHQVRHREARRILTLPSVRANTLATISFQGFLPAAEAGEQLAGSRRAADAEERAAASASFLLASARERRPAALTTALATLDGLRDERDPVRLAAANALARIPGWLLAETGIDRIEAFAHSAAEARDTSPATIHSLLGAAWVVIREAIGSGDIALARQGLEMVDTLAGPTGRLWFPSFEGMPRGGEALVIEALLPRLRTAAAKDNYGLLFTLCAALGKRAWGATQLDSLMHKALRAPQDANVRAAAEHWLADPATRATRVGEALRIDESLAVLPIVSNTLSASRQDLLDILWKRTSLTGRLWGRKPAFVPILPGPFTRWLPRQVQGYAAALDALLATEGTATWTASRAIRTLGRLPQIGTVALEPYLASPDTARREAALGALAWTGRPRDALPRLLAVRSGDDVRVAMYAAGRCLRDTPGRVALPLVLDVLRDPATKVTARKEAVRLLGRIREPEALVELLAIGLDDSTHRDVRFAVTRTLRAWLDDERSWQVLGRVAQSGREGALSIAETFPQLLAERHRAAYARLLVPGAVIRGASARQLAWRLGPVAPGGDRVARQAGCRHPRRGASDGGPGDPAGFARGRTR
ncbi:MAG: hypothetical protein V9G19_21945 [Tetrasphaera sp.]